MENKTHYAGLWMRLCADFIDSALLDLLACLAGLMVLGLMFWAKKMGLVSGLNAESSFLDPADSFAAQIFLIITRGVLSLLYFGYGTFRFGTTLGKRPFRIYVVASDKEGSPMEGAALSLQQSLTRCIAYLLSYVPLGAGFIMVGFHPQKRGLHDLIAGTVSIVKPKAF